MKRKIAVCGNGWSNEYLEIAMSGIRKCAEEENADVFFMLNFSVGNTEVYKQAGDININHLLEHGEFDGVILLANTFHLQPEFDYLCNIVKEKNLPAVSLEYHLPDIDFWGSDNYSGMYELCKHMVNEHGVKDVLFISGPEGNAESDVRRKALEDALGEKGYSLKEDHIIDGNWNYYEVGEKLPVWIEEYDKLPDVIVCANDVMAMAACSTLEKLDIIVPRDVKVTGFDHLLSVRTYYPTIASVDRNWDDMSYQSMKFLLKKIDGKAASESKYVNSRAVPGESCGCGACEKILHNKRIRENSSYANYVNNSFWSGHLCDITDSLSMTVSEEELHDAFSKCMVADHQYEGDEIYLCLADNFFSSLTDGKVLGHVGYTERMDLICGLKNGQVLERCIFETKDLVPGYDKDGKGGNLYIFLPLHSLEGCYGYVIFGNEVPMLYNYSVYNWTRSIEQNLSRVRQNIIIKELNNQLEKLSVTDGLTGVYNRFGCEKLAYPYLEECHKQGKRAIMMFADINKMKGINDKYGHLQGDIAICTVARVICEVLGDDWIVVRYGGDEFLMVGEDTTENSPEELMRSINEQLEKTTKKMQLPYPLKAGVGYVYVEADEKLDLSECLKRADEAMYSMKKQQHTEK